MCIWKSIEAEETKEHNVKGQCGKGARREGKKNRREANKDTRRRREEIRRKKRMPLADLRAQPQLAAAPD